MPDVETQVRDIKTRISQAQGQIARAEVERDNAQAAADSARARLKEEFGVSTPEEAREALAVLEADLAKAIEEATRALERTSA